MNLQLANVPFDKREKADSLVIPFWKDEKKSACAHSLDFLDPNLYLPLKSHDFTGKEGEIHVLYLKDQPEKTAIYLGLGAEKEASVEHIRRAYGALVKFAMKKKWKSLNILIPDGVLDEDAMAQGIVEGILLSNYGYDKLKSEKQELVQKVSFLGMSKKAFQAVDEARTIFEGVYWVRDQVNGNADDITPDTFTKHVESLARSAKVKVKALDKKAIEQEGLGLLLAVNRASHIDPKVVILEYAGNPSSHEKIVFVGKGITYDTGGLNLKPGSSMDEMKADMTGAAVVSALIVIAARLKLKVNIAGIVGLTENAIGPKSFKPGDVYKGHSGITVEIGNTDAEGRLLLADLLSYAQKHLNPSALIDVATLTGGIGVALGNEGIGLFSTNRPLANSLVKAGFETYERVCHLPMYSEYRELLRSDIADMKNVAGRMASAMVAAIFLREFVKNIPWAHLDIASVSFLTEGKRYYPKYATGIGLRLLVEFLKNYEKN